MALPFTAVTAYINTIQPDEETPLPGSQEIERRIKSLVRWNAMAMVVRANRESEGIGGHISTYASAASATASRMVGRSIALPYWWSAGACGDARHQCP